MHPCNVDRKASTNNMQVVIKIVNAQGNTLKMHQTLHEDTLQISDKSAKQLLKTSLKWNRNQKTLHRLCLNWKSNPFLPHDQRTYNHPTALTSMGTCKTKRLNTGTEISHRYQHRSLPLVSCTWYSKFLFVCALEQNIRCSILISIWPSVLDSRPREGHRGTDPYQYDE